MFLKDSMILELLASWKYEKQPVMMTTAVSTIPRYNWRKTQRQNDVRNFEIRSLKEVCVCVLLTLSPAGSSSVAAWIA